MLVICAAQTKVQCQTSQMCVISGTDLEAGQELVLPSDPSIGNSKKVVFTNSTLHSLPNEIFKKAPKVEQIVMAGCRLEEIGGVFTGSGKLQYLKKLYVGDNDIPTLEAGQFEKAVGMTDLDLSSNKIDKIAPQAFRSLKKLKDLNLEANRIETLEPLVFKDLTALTYLYLNDNQIDVLKLQEWGLTVGLIRLYIGGNKLEVITKDTFMGYQKVQKLDLSNNGITKLDEDALLPMRGLKFVNLSGNKLHILNQLKFSSKLNYLYLNSSKIQTINFDIFSKGVANVALQFNEITNITATKINSNTQNLNLAGNGMQNFPVNLKFEQLTDLALSDNPQLQWHPKMLLGFKKLKTLHLKAANLNASILEKRVLSNQLDLVNLDISFNNLSQLNLHAFNALPSLTDLTINNANLTELMGYESIKKIFPDLSFIQLSGNWWNCTYLDEMISTFYKMSVSLNGQDVVAKGRPQINNIECNRTEEQATTTETPTTSTTTEAPKMSTTLSSELEETTMMEMRTYIKILEEIPTTEASEEEVTTVKSLETDFVPESSEESSVSSEESDEVPPSSGETKTILPYFELGSYSADKENDSLSSSREEEFQSDLVVVSMPLIWTILAVVTVVLVILVYVVMCSNIVLTLKKTYVVKEPPGIQMEMKYDDVNDNF
jgi:Leucine rich repeat